jgi:DNA-directed RNA polymerase specialized sigma24 family protein
MVLVILFFNRRRIEQYNSILDLNAQTIERAQQRIEALSQESEAHDKEINRLNEKITSVRRSTNERLGRGKEVFDHIIAGGKLPPLADDENSLIEYYSVSHYATFHEWTTGYNHLTARLYTYLILQDMGKQDDDIARILCISPSAVRSIKSRVKARRRH